VWTCIDNGNALALERYRRDRVLLVGDAAHLGPIFGVHGATSGIGDADNLAWKLAFVIPGKAGEHLLHSCSQERQQERRSEERRSLFNVVVQSSQSLFADSAASAMPVLLDGFLRSSLGRLTCVLRLGFVNLRLGLVDGLRRLAAHRRLRIFHALLGGFGGGFAGFLRSGSDLGVRASGGKNNRQCNQ
jgi:hypothetical protein